MWSSWRYARLNLNQLRAEFDAHPVVTYRRENRQTVERRNCLRMLETVLAGCAAEIVNSDHGSQFNNAEE